MTQWSSIPLKSLELVPYAIQVECYVCGASNRFDAEFCRQCRAPLALAYPTGKKKIPPQHLAVLGAPRVGKTCYLGMLTDILSRRPSDLQMLAHGAFSVSLQQQTMLALAHRQFPPSTPKDPEGWRWVHCAVRSGARKRPLEFVFPDASGDAILEEVEMAPRIPAIRRLLTSSMAAIVLVETAGYDGNDPDPEFVAMKLIGDLLSRSSPNMKPWAERPVAVVFTKADRCDWALQSPEEYARQFTPGLWRQCREQLKNSRFFATSVAIVYDGVDAFGDRLSVPMRIEPRGVVEPFAWLVEQL